ncbi:MAG: hypothetical protein AAGD06_15610 [Acidobacteriota bacterium]
MNTGGRNIQDEREQGWRQTLEAAKVLRGRTAASPGAAPEPGELYLCRRTAEFPVEWLVVAVEGRRYRVVAVDDYPLVGSRDVELPSGALGGAAVARCGHGDWVGPKVLEPELRVAVLPEPDLGGVTAKVRALEEGPPEPTLLETVAEGDPEFQDWTEGTLAPAVEALSAKEQRSPAPWATAARRYWKPALALAALLALAVGLGVFARGLDRQLAEARARIAELESQGPAPAPDPGGWERFAELERARRVAEAEVTRLRTELDQRNSALASTRDDLTALMDRLAQAEDLVQSLRDSVGDGIAANVRRLVFGMTGGPTRGTPRVVKAGASPRILMELEVVDPEPYRTYRVRFVPKRGDVLTVDNLDRDGAWLRVSLPGDLLPVGEYRVAIEGMDGDRGTELAEDYRLVVEP